MKPLYMGDNSVIYNLKNDKDMTKKFVNLCPHAIVMNDGRSFPPSGVVARVEESFTPFNSDGIATQMFGDVQGLPAPQEGVYYIVSGYVSNAILKAGGKRPDVITPATGHPDTKRDENGHIKSVAGFWCICG